VIDRLDEAAPARKLERAFSRSDGSNVAKLERAA
jgi:hypothetical protein